MNMQEEMNEETEEYSPFLMTFGKKDKIAHVVFYSEIILQSLPGRV